MGKLVIEAALLSKTLLDIEDLSNRWLHVQGVARRARELAPTVDQEDRELLIAAAWLHDIGYAPSLLKTGMHAIDGAIHLQQLGYDERLVGLVAHHTGARHEAVERGLVDSLNMFAVVEGPVADALAAADLTTSPTGFGVDVEERIDEILTRYREGTPVYRAIINARKELVRQVTRSISRARGS